MIVHCPECRTRYTLTPQQVGEKGRTMRCAKCQHSWFQPPAVSLPSSPPPLPPENKVTVAPQVTGKQQSVLMAFALSLLFMGAGLGGAWIYLNKIADTPTKLDAYTPVVFDAEGTVSNVHDTTGLVLSNIERDVLDDGNVTILLFRGKVTNTNALPTPVPEIRVQLLDSKGVELDFWPAEVEQDELAAGKTSAWVVRFLNPPLDKIAQYKAFFRE